MSATEQAVEEAEGLEAIRDLPPSAKLVAKVLEYDGTLTQSQLAEETMLPPRTVRYALTRLEEQGVVESRFSFSDARKRLYSLSV
jgi:DNA-binding MarR family transcriptional regulator